MSGKLESNEDDRSAKLRSAWGNTLQLLSTKVNTVAFESFIRTIKPLSFDVDTVVLGVESAYQKDRLEKAHANAIRSAMELELDCSGLNIQFRVMLGEPQKGAARKASARRNDEAQPALNLEGAAWHQHLDAPDLVLTSPAPRPSKTAAKSPDRSSSQKQVAGRTQSELPPVPCLPMNTRYQLSDFLVGRSNRLASASAKAVVEKPGNCYNPLFIYGGPGLGKTHLLQGIAHAIRAERPDARVSYVSGEYFAQSYIKALRENTTEAFRRQYREVDVWIVDDIQFISNKEQTKEEFFHTFNSLYQSGKQIVLGSDRSPKELDNIDERLRSRFQSGLIADIGAPEADTRVCFLRAWRERESAAIPDDVLLYIARATHSNMRSLEGAITRLVAYSSIMHTPVTSELALDLLGEYFTSRPAQIRTVTNEDVITASAEHFSISTTALKGPGRSKEVSAVRQLSMYLCRELVSGSSLAGIGTFFGGRDHATVVYACQKVRDRIKEDADYGDLVKVLINRLTQ